MQKKLGVAITAAIAAGFVGGALFYNGGQFATDLGQRLLQSGQGYMASINPVALAYAGEGHGEDDDEHDEEGAGHAEATQAHDEEGGLTLSEAQIAAAGIEVAEVQARSMSTYISLPGEVNFNEERTAHVVPPSAGVVERVLVGLGQKVAAGEALAVIFSQQVSELRSEMAAAAQRVELAQTTFERERQLWQDGISAEQDYLQARQALSEARIALGNAQQKGKTLNPRGDAGDGSRYNLRAPFAGVVVEKHLVPGEVVGESSTTFTVADMSQVWVTFSVSPRDLERVEVGQDVRVIAPELGRETRAKVAYVSRLLGEQTRTATGRITLDNADGVWRPGLFVSVALVTERHEAQTTIPLAAIQEVEEQTSVFVRTAEGFEVRPVTLGTRSDGFVEVREGLKAGERVAASGSFVLKSELGKGSAEHAH
ncbi:efflux RND transporter periplasmic adaptor subunit [Pseudomonas sp. 8Z]|uniref:efflux RND transporter periplasmic adaptor subunit n=1 Tax=Pseudomonas sp. 8Z TaxID=2653166 RepID=UPI00135A045E|nr:efflux RND transporter periplasmic adaptor subunit [Pseudomonas sp. 8Z]